MPDRAQCAAHDCMIITASIVRAWSQNSAHHKGSHTVLKPWRTVGSKQYSRGPAPVAHFIVVVSERALQDCDDTVPQRLAARADSRERGCCCCPHRRIFEDNAVVNEAHEARGVRSVGRHLAE